MANIAVIGSNWYGCHIALTLAKMGHEVLILEENDGLLRGFSDNLTIQFNQDGKNSHPDFDEFLRTYPELIVKNSFSIPSKTSEYSIAVGSKLSNTFKAYLSKAKIKILFGYQIETIEKNGHRFSINKSEFIVDHIVSAACDSSIFPSAIDLPFSIPVVFQPHLGLIYEVKNSKTKILLSPMRMSSELPVSFAPYLSEEGGVGSLKHDEQYMLTSENYGVAGSFSTFDRAKKLLIKLHNDNTFVEKFVKPNCEEQISISIPNFKDQFKYVGWKGDVKARIRDGSEFDRALTFSINGMIFIIPGSINRIVNAEQEVSSLVKNKNVICKENYSYVQDGQLGQLLGSSAAPTISVQRMLDTQTYEVWFREKVLSSTSAQFNNATLHSYTRKPNQASQMQHTERPTAKL